ncbi:hypothetical protein O181_030226 [Austropuccinia psidii MF-1]|uniref:Uncharacterized protein n=1 Tax=Austropuccinia psidii MF-1 TaxID=1389203 RepID=A0A9Q3H422_9BASI|nr:hypothetical protein [Austropuccinia psidii MF-1]
MGALGPFWTKSNEAKRRQVGPPQPSLAPNLNLPKNGQKDPRTKIAHFQPLASGTHQRPPAQVHKSLPSIQGKESPSPMYSVTRDSGMVHMWYNIPLFTHFSQQWNGMLSGPDYAFLIQVPKSMTNVEGSLFSHSVLQFLAATRRPFEDPNHLALQELGCIFFQD